MQHVFKIVSQTPNLTQNKKENKNLFSSILVARERLELSTSRV